jgi:hypothetical protein
MLDSAMQFLAHIVPKAIDTLRGAGTQFSPCSKENKA